MTRSPQLLGYLLVFALGATLPAVAGSPNFADRSRDAEPQGVGQTPKPEHATPDQSASGSGTGAWQSGLNDYFGVNLTQPAYEAVLAALVSRLDQTTLAGVPPKQEFQRFESFAKGLRKGHPRIRPEVDYVEHLYRNLTAYLECEAEYSTSRNERELRQLVELVTDQATFTPDLPEERLHYIVDTIQTQRLFAPSSIVFGRYVLPYRKVNTPSGCRVMEVPVAPDYTDQPRRAQADIDFSLPPGPVVRMDFETVGTAKLSLFRSEDGVRYTLASEARSDAPDGVLAPLIPSKPVEARYLRLVAESAGPSAVLRNVRAFALKLPTAAVCSNATMVPVEDGNLDDAAWQGEFGLTGFVRNGESTFAVAQTAASFACARGTLFFAVRCADPRMETMAATLSQRDAALWEGEAVEVRIKPTGGSVYRFVVNPLGARFDSRDRDSGWNGVWRATVRKGSDAWTVEAAVPLVEIGLDGPENMQVNVIRYRHNVRDEVSAWCVDADGHGDADGLASLIAY